MNNLEIYINKAYSQLATYLKVKKTKSYSDALLEIKDYFNNLNRDDKEYLLSNLPSTAVSSLELTEGEIKELIQNILDKSNQYNSFFKEYTKTLKDALDKQMQNRGFSGTYPKYFLEKEEELLILEFDDDIYLKEENLNVTRQGLLIKVKNHQEVMPDFNIEKFSYMSLFFEYLDDIQNGKIKTFMIKLPERDYSKELTEENITEDIKYLEIVDCVLENKKYLPKWYINNAKTQQMIYKEIFLFTLIITALIGSFINMFLFSGNLGTLIAIWVVIGIIDHFICKKISEKKYNQYHNIK